MKILVSPFLLISKSANIIILELRTSPKDMAHRTLKENESDTFDIPNTHTLPM